MYESGAKSEASVARAVHILTLGAFTWEDNTSAGGTDTGVSERPLLLVSRVVNISYSYIHSTFRVSFTSLRLYQVPRIGSTKHC